MKKKQLLVAACCLLLTTPLLAQRRSMGAAGSPQRGSSAAGMQGSAGEPLRTRDRIHTLATTQQQLQARTCSQSTQQLRNRLRTMSRRSAGTGIGKDQAVTWREQLRTETQSMNREQQELMDGLNADQRSAVQNRSREMQTSREQFERMLDELDNELSLESPDPVKVRNQSREMEAALKKIQAQQQTINNELGLVE